MQYLRLVLAHLVPVKTWALSITVLLGALTALIQSSYASGSDASLCIRANLSNLEFLKANIWKYLKPLIGLIDAKNVSEYMISFMCWGIIAHNLVL